MLNNQSKSGIKTFGLIITICLSVFIFICLFLVGFDYKEAHQNWINNGGWRHLAIVQVTTVVVAFVVIILGFLVFTCMSETKPVIGIFVGVNGLSMVLTLGISIFALVAGSVGSFGDYIGCNTPYTRILKYWGYIDYYLIEVDKKFCSADCKCYLNDDVKTMFTSDPFISKIADNWETSSDKKMINFQDACTTTIKKGVLTDFNASIAKSFNDPITFNEEKFNSYWKHIEERFECSGWCTTAYQGAYTTAKPTGQIPMVKYLFSDINKGIVKHRGCLKQILKWLPEVMVAYGSLTLIASFLQVIVFILGLSLLLRKGDSEEARSPQKEKIDNKKSEDNELNHPNL